MPIYDRWGPIEANTAAGVSSSQSSSPYDPLAGWKPPPLGKYYQPAPPLPPPSQRPYGAAYFAEPYFAASPDFLFPAAAARRAYDLARTASFLRQQDLLASQALRDRLRDLDYLTQRQKTIDQMAARGLWFSGQTPAALAAVAEAIQAQRAQEHLALQQALREQLLQEQQAALTFSDALEAAARGAISADVRRVLETLGLS